MLYKKLNYLYLMVLVLLGLVLVGGFVGGMVKFVLFSVGVLFCGVWFFRLIMILVVMVLNYILWIYKII